MNLFYLETSPQGAAQALCDKHIPKMTLETAQMLSSACWAVLSPPNHSVLPYIYKPAYWNHPSTAWVRSGVGQYVWTYGLFQALCKEFLHRGFKNGEPHASSKLLHALGHFDVLTALPSTVFDAPPQCMPEQYQQNDTLQAYRDYYLGDKMRFAKWERGRSAPDWMCNEYAYAA